MTTTGTEWQLTAVTNNDFTLCHVLAINADDSDLVPIAIMGQEEYATRAQARTGANTEIYNLQVNFPIPEVVPIATFIFETKDSFANDVKAVIRTTEDGEDYVDWRVNRNTVLASV